MAGCASLGRFLVSGRVQGVGFRYFAQDAARREGLHGYVPTTTTARVEAVAEGEAESLERFERALRRGPSRSRVEHVMVDEHRADGPGTPASTIR